MELTFWLAQCPLPAILRGVKPDEAVPVGEALASERVAIVEVPLNSPQPLDSMVLPVGGIDVANIAGWREAGAAGIGSAMYRPGDRPETVAAKARGLVSAGGS